MNFPYAVNQKSTAQVSWHCSHLTRLHGEGSGPSVRAEVTGDEVGESGQKGIDPTFHHSASTRNAEAASQLNRDDLQHI